MNSGHLLLQPPACDVDPWEPMTKLKCSTLGEAMLLVRHCSVLENTPMGPVARNVQAVSGSVFVFRLQMKALYFPQNFLTEIKIF